MKLKYNILVVLLLLLVVSCDNSNPIRIKTEYIGLLKDCNVVSTSFNESVKTEIKTENYYCVIRSIPTLRLGDSTYLYYYDNNRVYLGTQNSSMNYFVRYIK